MPRPASLSPELLLTFVTLVQTEGDASRAAEILGINQPSMSKRLAQLQHAGRILKRPWLERRGKTWRMTDEGQRVLPAVDDLLRRLDQLKEFAQTAAPPGLSFACGREAIASFVLEAVKRFRREQPQVKFRLATLRGERRIEGVASGALDLAVVTHEPDQIRHIARRVLLVEELFSDPLVLVCPGKSPWAEAFRPLPEKPVPGKSLVGLPLVLPEGNSGIREAFESLLRKEALAGKLDVAVEVGGWSAILACVKADLGVGLVPRSVQVSLGPAMLVRTLHHSINPPNVVRLIGRALPGTDRPDLSEPGLRFRDALRAAAQAVRDAIEKAPEPPKR